MTSRRILLGSALLAVAAAAAYVVVRNPRFVALLQTDVANPEEASKLNAAKLVVGQAAGPGAGWPQWRGPFRDGRAPAGPMRTDWDKRPPVQVWTVPCGQGFGSPTVAVGMVYLHDREGGEPARARERIRCLDAATGKALWEHVYEADYTKLDKAYANGPRATPTVDGDRVYALGAVGTFLCVRAPPADGATARELWRHDLLDEFEAGCPQWGMASSPLLEGNAAIVQPGGGKGTVAAFDKATGALLWKAGDGPNGYSSPIAATLAGTRVVLALTGNSLLCVGAGGTVLAEYRWRTPYDGNVATPIVVDDYAFISSAYNHGCALLRARAGPFALEEVFVRQNKTMRNHHSSCVFKDGFLYGFDDSRLKCVDFRRCEAVKGWEAEGVEKGCLLLAGDRLIVLTERGGLALVEATPEEFRLVAKCPSGLDGKSNWALPALADGRLYLRDENKLICLDVR